MLVCGPWEVLHVLLLCGFYCLSLCTCWKSRFLQNVSKKYRRRSKKFGKFFTVISVTSSTSWLLNLNLISALMTTTTGRYFLCLLGLAYMCKMFYEYATALKIWYYFSGLKKWKRCTVVLAVMIVKSENSCVKLEKWLNLHKCTIFLIAGFRLQRLLSPHFLLYII